MTHANQLLKVCVNCMTTRPISEFPSREGGKTRARCTPCFRNYVNSRRRKGNRINDITNFPVVISYVDGAQESWIEVVAQILTDKKFLMIQETNFSDELIDIKALLKTENHIAKLVGKEMVNEKNSYLSPCFNRRTSQGRRRLD